MNVGNRGEAFSQVIRSTTKPDQSSEFIQGHLIHADETPANIKGQPAYVWVLTSMEDVVYLLAESREGRVIQDLLKDFRGVVFSLPSTPRKIFPMLRSLCHPLSKFIEPIEHNVELRHLVFALASLEREEAAIRQDVPGIRIHS
jgi:hypothetical protein